MGDKKVTGLMNQYRAAGSTYIKPEQWLPSSY